MKIITVLLICLLYSWNSFSQVPDWRKTTDWRKYDFYKSNAFDYPIDSLYSYQYIALDDNKMRSLLADAKPLNIPSKNVYWMGLYVVTYMLDNRPGKMEVSMYGGFFYDDISKKYYQVDSTKKFEWLDYFSNTMVKH